MDTPTAERSPAPRELFPTVLFVGALAISTILGFAPPAGRLNFALEVLPGLIPFAVFVALQRRLPLSALVYLAWFVHVLVLDYGGYYTYAATPLGNWARDTFHLNRNHYDRVGHLALGFFPALTIRELLLRRTPLHRDGWLAFITLAIAFAIGAFWELVEWWTTLLVAGDVGQAFLGSQGDPWDAQWDMLLVGVGAAISLATLSTAHDRSIARSDARPCLSGA